MSVVMETTKCRSVVEQTRNNDFHINRWVMEEEPAQMTVGFKDGLN